MTIASTQQQVEEIVALVEELLREERFDQVDDYLGLCIQAAPLMDPPLLLAILTITMHAKTILQRRTPLLAVAETRMIEVLGFNRTQELLRHRR